MHVYTFSFLFFFFILEVVFGITCISCAPQQRGVELFCIEKGFGPIQFFIGILTHDCKWIRLMSEGYVYKEGMSFLSPSYYAVISKNLIFTNDLSLFSFSFELLLPSRKEAVWHFGG